MKITRGVRPRPRNVLLYGEHKTGKTTLASTWPNPILVDVEGGSDDIDIARGSRVTSYMEFVNQVSWLITNDHGFHTVIFDSIDWLEKLIWADICKKKGVKSIADIDYGKGFDAAAAECEPFINAIRLLNKKGMATVQIGHAKKEKHSPPGQPSYDRWEPDLHKNFRGPIVEFVDEIFFLKKEVITITEDKGFGQSRGIAAGTERRILVCSDTGSVMAGNRIGMPKEIPATFQAYVDCIHAYQQRAQVSAGVEGLRQRLEYNAERKAETTEPAKTDDTIVIPATETAKPTNEAAEELANTKIFG